MPRSEGQKLKLLYLKQIFEEYSDENHRRRQQSVFQVGSWLGEDGEDRRA